MLIPTLRADVSDTSSDVGSQATAARVRSGAVPCRAVIVVTAASLMSLVPPPTTV